MEDSGNIVTVIIIIIIIIISGLVPTYKNKNSRHYNVIKRSHKNSSNKNVFKKFLEVRLCLCLADSFWKSIPGPPGINVWACEKNVNQQDRPGVAGMEAKYRPAQMSHRGFSPIRAT